MGSEIYVSRSILKKVGIKGGVDKFVWTYVIVCEILSTDSEDLGIEIDL